jgi:predicted nucleotidyltransferase
MDKIDITGIREICRRHSVRLLFLFGSATKDAETARDIDFIVEFEPVSPKEHANAFFGLLEELESLLRKPVDLVELRAVRNPYFLKELEQTKVPIYEAA